MPVQIALIGLGQIGTSIGLALAGQKESLRRIGHDRRVEAERHAENIGAVDKAVHNLPAAVQDCRLVVLSLPLSQVRDTLKVIAPELQDGVVVLDMAPVKSEIVRWASEFLPQGRYYVGLVPSVNPAYLDTVAESRTMIGPDLFKKAVFMVDAPMGTPEPAVTLACSFVGLLGATPLLTNLQESDGLIAAAHLMPQLVSAAILGATVDQPGWEDARKVASRAFAAITSGVDHYDEIVSLRMAASQNSANLVRVLDVLAASLKSLRDDIADGNEAGLAERLEIAHEGRERWLNERFAADWTRTTAPPEAMPTLAERLLGGAIVRPRRGK